MKDSEFIELLNLYLDHEISAADAVRLEAEVQNNPARRRVYQQYCRMQKACRMVAADFSTDTEGLAWAAEKKVVAFDPAAVGQGKPLSRLYTVGTFAAIAACVAIVFVGRNHQRASGGSASMPAQPIAQVTPVTSSSRVPVEAPPPRGLVTVSPRSHTLLVEDPLLLSGRTQAEAVLAVAGEQGHDQLEWIKAVQLTPLQQHMPGEFRFDATLRSEGRALGNRASTASKPQQAGDEMVGFQFIK